MKWQVIRYDVAILFGKHYFGNIADHYSSSVDNADHRQEIYGERTLLSMDISYDCLDAAACIDHAQTGNTAQRTD
jgi:hypothetical protein